jgi:hypothetical protein
VSRNWTPEQYAEVQARLARTNPRVDRRPVDLGTAGQGASSHAPPPARRNRRPEEALQTAIVAYWRPRLVPGARLFATNGELPGGKEQAGRAGRRKAMGYTRGTPDLCSRRRGALLWLEVKVPPNTPTDEQAQWASWAIDDCGDGWCVVTSVENAGVPLRAYGMVA